MCASFSGFPFISPKFVQILNKPAAQAAWQTLPDATPPVGKIHPFSNIAVNSQTIQQIRCPSRFRFSEKTSN